MSKFSKVYLSNFEFVISVIEIEEKEIEKVFGEDDTTVDNKSDSQTSSNDQPNPPPAKKRKGHGTNAYMLMYRRISQDNKTSVFQDQIPLSIQTLIQKENKEFEEEKEKFRIRKESLHLRIHFKDKSEMIVVHKTESLKTAMVNFDTKGKQMFLTFYYLLENEF